MLSDHRNAEFHSNAPGFDPVKPEGMTMPAGFESVNPEGMDENSPAFQRWDRGTVVLSPEGTAGSAIVGRPFGTHTLRRSSPALKRWAILNCPFRDIALSLLLSCLACSALADPNVPVRFLRTPAQGLQPQTVVDSYGAVHLVYLRGDPKASDVFYARRAAGSSAFSTPIRVNSAPGSAIAIGTVRGAQLALGRNDRVHVVWNGSQPATDPGAKGSPMLYTRLDDSGHAFEPQRNLMTCTMNLDGGGSVAADRAGNVYAVWHGHLRTGPDDEVHRGVYVARSTDDGKTFTPEKQVNPEGLGVCGCCGLKASTDRRGDLAIVFRSADEIGNRDSMLLLSADHGNTFRSLLLGKWRSSTCPMSTPALDQGPDNVMLAMWETQGQVFRRALYPNGPDSSSVALAADGNPGNRKHPVAAFNEMNGSHLLLAWVEGTGWEKGGSLAWECIDLKSGGRSTGSRPGVPAWDLAAVIPERDGGFTIIY